MRVRSGALTGWAGGGLGLLTLLFMLGLADPSATAGQRVVVACIVVGLGLLCLRVALAGIEVRAKDVVVRSVFWSKRLAADDIAGLAIEPVVRRRFARLVVVTTGDEFVPCVFASWRMGKPALQNATLRTTGAIGWLTAARSAVPVATAGGRLEHASAFTAVTPNGQYVAVPAITPDRGLTPASVRRTTTPLLGYETIAVAAAFVLPAAVTAIVILSRHVERVSDLDEFELPLPHHLPASLVLMVLLYLSTAVFVPIALLLLARTGQWPGSFGLSRTALRLDLLPGVGLLIGSWITTFVVGLVLSPLLNNNALSNSQHNTHVPAYFVIYALVVSATTAINEEIIVNGYVMTRLAQLGWTPWRSLAVSLALRTSYHAYYGVALIATVPFGYWATRSFQKHGRLGRPIVAHFLNDAVLLTVAVLTS